MSDPEGTVLRLLTPAEETFLQEVEQDPEFVLYGLTAVEAMEYYPMYCLTLDCEPVV